MEEDTSVNWVYSDVCTIIKVLFALGMLVKLKLFKRNKDQEAFHFF
jgi:hypothetical protein